MKLTNADKNKISQLARNISTHSKGGHGKCLEDFLAKKFSFPKYEQYKEGMDFPKEIVEQGKNVPSEWVMDWEVKFYNIKTNCIVLGELENKIKHIKKGFALVIGFYDGDPSNIVDIKFIKMQASSKLLKDCELWKGLRKFVHDRTNPLEKTREVVKDLNKKAVSPFRVLNISSRPRFSQSLNRMLGEARQVSLSLNVKNLALL